MNRNDKRVRWACYTSNISMAVVGNLSPLLFLTFRGLYGISYSLLGLLVLINFVTQLTVDLIFSFFSHKFNIPLAVKMTPYLTIAGLILYAMAPILFPTQVYVGLVIGTVIFSAASGFCEVLISPVIAALPSENPERDMSKLHSIYAWGVVGVILFATLFLLVFGARSWQILSLFFVLIPLSSAVLFGGAKLPMMDTPEKASGILALMRKPALWLCVFAIFLGGASECTMAQWCSGYLEEVMGIPKVWGDVFGVALFGTMLGLGRTMYAKYGSNIERVLLFSAVGATLCYGTAALSGLPILGLIACGMTGFFTAMLWPGCLIVAADRVPTGGVFIYAMMAAGGDLGASVGPQMMGIVTDTVADNSVALELATRLGLSGEQLGMKTGLLLGMLFPLIAIAVYFYLWKSKKKRERTVSNL